MCQFLLNYCRCVAGPQVAVDLGAVALRRALHARARFYRRLLGAAFSRRVQTWLSPASRVLPPPPAPHQSTAHFQGETNSRKEYGNNGCGTVCESILLLRAPRPHHPFENSMVEYRFSCNIKDGTAALSRTHGCTLISVLCEASLQCN